jgi:RNA polymerase sigma factor (sigma-70 family)
VSLDESLADPNLSPEAQLLAAERVAELHGLLDTLKREQKEALLLQHLEGLSHVQIATVLGKSPAAVNSLLQRARVALETRGAAYFLPETTEERR